MMREEKIHYIEEKLHYIERFAHVSKSLSSGGCIIVDFHIYPI
jgi:hypothetical protein